MSLLSRWFAPRPELSPEQAERLAAWQARLTGELPARWCVVDVETGGLDVKRDPLIAIGSVAVEAGALCLGDRFEVVLKQAQASTTANILVHGIGATAQLEGVPPADALLDFLDWLGASPLVAFHAAFDATAIRRACRLFLGFDFDRPWLDLAYVAPDLMPREAASRRTLDEWCGFVGVGNAARHNASADAVATGELLLALRGRMDAGERGDYAEWRSRERSGHRRLHP